MEKTARINLVNVSFFYTGSGPRILDEITREISVIKKSGRSWATLA